MNIEQQMKGEIRAAGQRLAAQGLLRALSGNISCRLPDGSLLITAAKADKTALLPGQILQLNAAGQPLEQGEQRPSSETGLHLALYRRYPQIGAVVHAHPPYATALATAGRELDTAIAEESLTMLGKVALLPLLPAGSAELAAATAENAAGASAVLLAGHGAVSWGEDLGQALCRMEIVEHTARMQLYLHLWLLSAE